MFHEKKLWHRDIVDSSLHEIPLTVEHVNLDSRNPLKLEQEVVPPIAPSLVLPHVLDSPRTQLRKIQDANSLLSKLPILTPGELSIENGEEGTSLIGSSQRFSSESNGGKMVSRGAPPPTSAVIALLNKKEDTCLLDDKGIVKELKLPGMTSTACYPWMLMKHTDKVTLKEVEFYYNVETKRSKWDSPGEGALWERKLALLQQLTPRPVDPTAEKRGLVKGNASDPDRWMWRETEAESRKRMRYIKDRDREARKELKRRREKPTTKEQVSDVLTLMVRAVVERDARRKNKSMQRSRRRARLTWHPSTLGRNFARLPIYHTNNPTFKPPPPLPSPPGQETVPSEDVESVEGVRLVTDMDLSSLVDGIRTTSCAGRLPWDPASRLRPVDYVAPKLAVILKQIELEGTTWFDHVLIGANKVRARLKDHQEKKKQRRLANLEEGGEEEDSDDDGSDEYDSDEDSDESSGSEEEESDNGWLPKVMQPAQRLVEVIRSSAAFIPSSFKPSDSYDSSSRPEDSIDGSFTESDQIPKDASTIEGGLEHSHSGSHKSKKLALTPEEKRKKSDMARANFTDLSGLPLDSASVTLELACPLPPRFQMVPNPMHPDNMHPVKRAIHQA